MLNFSKSFLGSVIQPALQMTLPSVIQGLDSVSANCRLQVGKGPVLCVFVSYYACLNALNIGGYQFMTEEEPEWLVNCVEMSGNGFSFEHKLRSSNLSVSQPPLL